MHLLLITRGTTDRASIAERLTADGMQTCVAHSLAEARAMIHAGRHDLALLDLSVRDSDAMAFMADRTLRAQVSLIALLPSGPVSDAMLERLRDVDDWMTHPVSVPELITRIRAVRARATRTKDRVLRAGPLSISVDGHHASCAGQPIELSQRAHGVLAVLVRRSGRPVPRAVLEETAYGPDGARSANAIEAMLSRIRRTLKSAGCPVRITAVRGVGWRLVIPEAQGGTGP